VVWGTVLLGLGLGGFFDGIVLHQILQWHHMVTSAGYPANTVGNLEFNTLLDGPFYTSTYMMTAVGLGLLWSATRLPHVRWSTSLLVGWGTFNVIEGIVDHHLLGLHHVKEGSDDLLAWDIGFLAWGAIMLVGELAADAEGGSADRSGRTWRTRARGSVTSDGIEKSSTRNTGSPVSEEATSRQFGGQRVSL
jgi:uncharacterized membrane protein